MGERFINLALKNTDDRVCAEKAVSPAFLFATLLWHEVLVAWQKYQAQNHRPIPALYMAMTEVADIQAEKLAIHKRFSAIMREIWGLQPRFEQRAGKRPYGLLAHPRYRAAYDFLLLRCESGELPVELGTWWTDFANADAAGRETMLLPHTSAPGSEPRKRRRRSRRKPTASATAE
jgi:poly(A) polymerase